MFLELGLIAWKNLLIRKRHWLLTIFEVVIPTVLFVFLVWFHSELDIHNSGDVSNSNVSIFEPENIEPVILSESHLWYAPQNDFTEELIRRVQQTNQIPGDAIKGYFDFATLDKACTIFQHNKSITAVYFNTNDTKKLNYDLRIHDRGLRWKTDKLFNLELGGGSFSLYIYRGFLAMQKALDLAFIDYSLENQRKLPLNDFIFQIEEFPTSQSNSELNLKQMIVGVLPHVTFFSFIFLCPSVLKRIVEEKASGIKEYMKMVGMKSWMLWLSWYIHALVTNIVSLIITVILLKVSIMGTEETLLEHTDGGVLFIFMALYCIAGISLCFMLSSFFQSPPVALIFAITFWLLSYFVPFEVINDKMPWFLRIILSLLPNAAMIFGFTSIAEFETKGLALSWGKLFSRVGTDPNSLTMGNVYLILLFDIILYLFLAEYLDSVRPGQYGIAKPLTYPFTSIMQFFRSKCSKSTQVSQDCVTSLQNNENCNKCIEVLGLKKCYGTKMVVDDLSFFVPRKQITVFLGHNGAGKTTTMSIMTGMVPASGGTVLINGTNIRNHMSNVRKDLGLCPQHNLLFPDLTVIEHLQFFARLRGSSSSKAKEEAEKMVTMLGLKDKTNTLPPQLSGGMKRKLCLGMSMVGNASILILDEPTAGVDPESRRKLWNILLEERKSKTVFISTHFMDEAEALADYIVIIGNGRKLCEGSPFELKKRYDTGYYLHLTLDSSANTEEIIKSTLTSKYDSITFSDSSKGNQLVFKLPFAWKDIHPDFLEFLEDHQQEWKIDNIYLELTTLQDLFMKTKQSVENGLETNGSAEPPRYEEPNPSLLSIFKTLIYKRWLFMTNSPFTYLPAFLIFTLMFSLVILLNKPPIPKEGAEAVLSINLNAYGKTDVYFSGENSSRLISIKNYYKNEVKQQESQPIEVANLLSELIKKEKENIAYYTRSMIVGAQFLEEGDDIKVIGFYSSKAIHSVPISFNLVTNTVAKYILNDSYSISCNNRPFPQPDLEQMASEAEFVLNWMLTIPIAMLILVGNYIIFSHAEVSTGFMQLQFTSGVPVWLYWISNFIFDYILFFIQIFGILFIMYFCQYSFENSFYSGSEFISIFGIFMLHGIGIIPYTYAYAYRKTFAAGFSLHLIIGMIFGLILAFLIHTLKAVLVDYSIYGNILMIISACLCPPSMLVYVLILFSGDVIQKYNARIGLKSGFVEITEVPENKLFISNDNYYLVFLLIAPFIIYLSILLIINSMSYKKILRKIAHCCKNIYETFVKADKFDPPSCHYMDNDPTHEKLLEASKLQKSYGFFKHLEVVRNVTFKVKQSECYGLLGVNGAGKTTTFMMLTKSMPCDSGEVKLLHEDKPVNDDMFYRNISYCPQNDALNFSLTGKQLLTIIAMLRGYNKDQYEKFTNFLLDEFDLREYENKKCGTYSGGNLRKLSASIAFLGKLKVILLDEPTAGIDPGSRQKFWGTLLRFKKLKRSFILCSHSMEECEVLCDRIGIMKKGQLACDGRLPSLRQQYQKGYKIILKLNTNNGNNKDVDEVDGIGGGSSVGDDESQQNLIPKNTKVSLVTKKKDAITVVNIEEDTFDDKISNLKKSIGELSDLKVTFQDEYADFLHYHTSNEGNLRLSEIFDRMRALKQVHPTIDDFIITNASLEDIFLTVANTTQ